MGVTTAVFSATTTRYIEKYIGKGDLVHARGRVRQNTYERDDGERVFTVDLICNDFSRLAQAADNRDGEHRDADARDNSSGAGKGARLLPRMTPFPTDRSAGGEAPCLPSSLFRSFVNREGFSDSTTSRRARRRTAQVLPRASRTAPRSRRSSRTRSRATLPSALTRHMRVDQQSRGVECPRRRPLAERSQPIAHLPTAPRPPGVAPSPPPMRRVMRVAAQRHRAFDNRLQQPVEFRLSLRAGLASPFAM